MSNFERVTSPWIEFAGVRSTALGVKLMSLPTIEMTIQRGDKKQIDGRDGILYVTDGGYAETDIQIDMGIPDGANLSGVLNWLRGSGHLILSTDSTYYRDAMVITQAKAQPMSNRLNAYKLTATFTCDPLKHLVTESDIEVTARATVFAGQGHTDTKPLLKVEGIGEVELLINNTVTRMTLTSGIPIFVDCDSKIAYTETTVSGVTTRTWAGGSVYMLTEWPYMSASSNTVNWTGNITKVTITPRWGWY